MSKNEKKNKLTIKGFVLVGVSRDVDFYYSRAQNKFVDDASKLYVSDLLPNQPAIDVDQIKADYPLIDSIKGVAKVKLTIKL